jgi:hypothetical protein
VRSLCRSWSLQTVARELAKYSSDLVGVKKVIWDKSRTELAQHRTIRGALMLIAT